MRTAAKWLCMLLALLGLSACGGSVPEETQSAETASGQEETALKTYTIHLIRHGLTEGNEKGPFFFFNGLDNNIYYMLPPDCKYYNFSGFVNVLN